MSFEVEGIDNLMADLEKMDIERIAPVMLEEAVPILQKSVINKAQKHKVSGEMVKSIKSSSAQRNQRGYYICVRPTGKAKKGIRNMEKMAYLEFGTSKQAATPTLSPAVKDAEHEVIQKMQEVFEREAGL